MNMGKIIAGSVIWLGVIPFLMGTLLLSFTKRKEDNIAECMTTGYFVMFTVCQILVVPMILTEVPFHVFSQILAVVLVLLAVMGLLRTRKRIWKMLKELIKGAFRYSWTVYAAAAAVLVQAYYYIQYMVTNLDDAYYVGVATTALQTDSMYRYSPYTGRAVTGFNLRYCLSPFSMLQAALSKWIGVHPSTLDHTILAPVLVILAYLVYWSMGKLLFSKESGMDHNTDSTEKMTGLFILFLSIIHVTSYYCIRNQGSVLLVRIWQGKAVLASVLIPFLFYHCYRMARRPEEKGNVVILLTAMFSCCLVSSMGIALPVVLLGIFALLFGLFQKNAHYFWKIIAGCLPCALYGILYIAFKNILG